MFEGESVQANGTPLFLYEGVDTGIGLAAKLAVTVAREGVYFMSVRACISRTAVHRCCCRS